MRISRYMLPVATAASLAACASTAMTSMVNPDVAAPEISRVLVFFPSDDLADRQRVEGAFADRKGSITFVPAHTVLFPGRTYSEMEVSDRLVAESIDGVLVVSLSDVGSSTSILPTTSQTRCTLISSGGCQATTTTTTGGGTISKPNAAFQLALVEPSSREVIWVATAESGGNAFADMDNLIDSLADETMSQLVSDGLIPPGT